MVRDQLSPSRKSVLALLRTHATQQLDAYEATMVQATREFVEAYPNCADRSVAVGHLTGSAWIVDPTRERVLLTHHQKLDKWLQLGGHADGDFDLAAVAMREAEEESGLTRLRLVSPGLFDLDRHRIPARRDEPEHWHYDFRFLIEADPAESLILSSESKALSWVELARIESYTTEVSILRMVRKTIAPEK